MFGKTSVPRAVVAGAGTGVGRLPPSTLYMRVLALKVAPCLSPVANTHIAKIGDDQGVEQVSAFPLQKVPGPGQQNRPGPVRECHLAGVYEIRADDLIIHAVKDQRGDVDLAVEHRRR